MKIWGKNRKVLVATVVCSFFAYISSAFAFIWPVINMQKIATTIKNINSMISQATNVSGQIRTTVGKINAIGDVVGSIKKFADDLKSALDELKSAVSSIMDNIKSAINVVKDTIESVNNAITDGISSVKNIVGDVTQSVNGMVDQGASKEEVIDTVQTAEDEANGTKDEMINQINTFQKEMEDTLDKSSDNLSEIVDVISEYDGLSEEQCQDFKDRADNIQNDIDNLKNDINEILENIKSNYDEQYSMFVTSAFSEYIKAINDYYNGDISKDDLAKAGERLNKSVSSLDVQIDDGLITKLSEQVESISQEIDTLEEDILNAISNNKDYSDEAYLKLNNEVKYSFSYSEQIEISHASMSYTSYEPNVALISRELVCEGSDAEKFISDIIDDGPTSLLKCVIDAKNGGENALYKPYSKTGVFHHMLQDYSITNQTSIAQTKEFANSWINGNDGSYKKLNETINKDSTDTRAAYSINKLVDVETPKLWSQVRRIDSLFRAKEVVKEYGADRLYLEDEDYISAMESKRGVAKVAVESGAVDVSIFPNVILYYCNLKADDVSAHDGNTADKAEENIAKCLLKFAKMVKFGTDEDSGLEAGNAETTLIWKENQKRSLNDASFETLTLSIINNYISSRDYVEGEDENILSIYNESGDASQLRDEYIVGAKLNKYAANQILDIVNADASFLQREIIKDLETFNFNFFPEENEKE